MSLSLYSCTVAVLSKITSDNQPSMTMITKSLNSRSVAEDGTAFLEAINRAAVAYLAKSRGLPGPLDLRQPGKPRARGTAGAMGIFGSPHGGLCESPAFAQWREVIGPFFQSPPNVEHFDDVTAP